MLIIIDYDETYTAAPVLWGRLITMALEYGHTVVCCTMRPDNDVHFNADVIADMGQYDVEIIYAADHTDKWAAVIAAGYEPGSAIWIDDRPMYIFMDKTRELPD